MWVAAAGCDAPCTCIPLLLYKHGQEDGLAHIERRVPPAVGEVHRLPRADLTLERACIWRQRGQHVQQPRVRRGHRRELGPRVRRVQEPSLPRNDMVRPSITPPTDGAAASQRTLRPWTTSAKTGPWVWKGTPEPLPPRPKLTLPCTAASNSGGRTYWSSKSRHPYGLAPMSHRARGRGRAGGRVYLVVIVAKVVQDMLGGCVRLCWAHMTVDIITQRLAHLDIAGPPT